MQLDDFRFATYANIAFRRFTALSTAKPPSSFEHAWYKHGVPSAEWTPARYFLFFSKTKIFHSHPCKQIKLRLINYSFANVTTVGVSRFSPRKTLWSYLKKGTLLTQRRKLVTDCWRTSVCARSDFSHIPSIWCGMSFCFDLRVCVSVTMTDVDCCSNTSL